MQNSMRFAVVLFFLGVLSIVTLLGGDGAKWYAIGGPEGDDIFFGETAGDFDAVTADAGSAIPTDFDEDVFAIHAAASGSADDEAGEPGDSADAATEEDGRPRLLTHIVQRGETLWDIALAYGIDVDTIVAANDLVDINRLQIGQELTILTVRGALHTVQRGESLWDISSMYSVPMDEIVATNGITNPSRIQVSQQLIIPGAQATAAALRREALVSSTGQLLRNFDWPTRGRISSHYGPRWGRMHYGLDLAVPTGTPITAAAAGTVTYSGAMGTYGIIVIIDHGNGVETRYAHLSRTAVSVGQRVKRGQLIAYSGNTGNSTGPHLHFEIRHRGQAVDPEQYLKR